MQGVGTFGRKKYLCSMKCIVQHIEYLLTRHDCVVVPGWGAWIVQSVSAVVADDAAPQPPRRWLSFNASLSHNDGMLAHSIMRTEGCSYDEAMTRIAAEVSSWRTALQEGQDVTLGHIGSFCYENGGLLLFRESAYSVVNAPLSMLPHIAMLPLAEMQQEEVDVVAQGWRQVPKPRFVRRFMSAAASVVALVVVLLFISTPVDNYPTQNDYASIVAAELFAASPLTEAASSVETEFVAAPVEEVAPDVTAETTEQGIGVESEPSEAKSDVAVPKYILVVGSLPTYALAEKQIGEFRAAGVTAPLYIYDNGSKARLYTAGYDTLAEAERYLASVQRDEASPFVGIWICRTR